MDCLLSYSEELAQGYKHYQSFLRVLCYSDKKEQQEANIQEFNELLAKSTAHLPENYRKTMKTYKTYREEIILSLTVPYSNGPVEATNNHIKVIERSAYGFRNFVNFKTRLFLNQGKYFQTKPAKQKRKKPSN